MKMKSVIRTGVAALGLAGLLALDASAALLVDRGLPTANLNNAAGANRSNVSWVFGGYTTTDYYVVGDSFTNTSSLTWNINQITVWITGPATGVSVSLWGGLDNAVSPAVAGTLASSPVTYADVGNSSYQATSGTFRDIYQVDFTVNVTLAPGDTYNFFIDGTGAVNVIPFAHASNAALSGSTQQGSDDTMLYAEVINGLFQQGSVGTWTSLGNGWDKASDVNVQVFGTAVPEPGTLAILGIGLAGLCLVRGRKLS